MPAGTAKRRQKADTPAEQEAKILRSTAADPPFLPPTWPAQNVQVRKVADLVPYANNSRIHSKAQIKQLCASITEFGFTIPVLIDDAGMIIAGHGRVMAASALGYAEVPCMIASGWTETQKRAYVIADNKLTENGAWDESILRLEMAAILGAGFDLRVTGFAAAEIRNLRLPDPASSGGDSEGMGSIEVGKLLGLVEITIAEPRHKVEKGEHYTLGAHHLFCISVITDWKIWAPYLSGDALFCGYPGVFVPFGEKAVGKTIVMVQPDPYIAGHILDRYSEVYGEASVALVNAE